MENKKSWRSLLLYLGIPIVIIIIIVLVIGNMPQKTMKYSEILNYFETQQVTEFDLDLGSGAMVLTLSDGDESKKKEPTQIQYSVPNVTILYEDIKPYIEEYNKDHPDAKICFVGPCAAKKLEANRKSVRSDVDYVLTFEELQGMFDAKSVDFATLEADPNEGMNEGTAMGRGFAVVGGVAAAVKEAIGHMDPSREVPIEYGDGLRECRKMLMMAKAGKRNGYLLEGMACPGGCVAGAGTMQPVKKSQAAVNLYASKAKHKNSNETEHVKELDKLVY